MKAVIYARVSSDEQQKEGFSIPAQIELLENYAKRNNIEVVKVYEEAQTAKQAGRVKFNEMLNFLHASKDINAILVEKTDRLYRNFKDYVLIDENKFEIHLVKENEIIGKNATSHQKFVHGIKVLMAKNFIDNLSEETKKGRFKKVQEGYFIAQVPYGYKKLDPRTTVIDEEKAPFVKRAFELYSQGELSLDKVREKLYSEKLFYLPSTTKVSKPQLEYILKNPSYTGVINFQGELYKGRHEAIISEKLFEKTQKAFKKDGKPLTRKEHHFLFAGMLKCGECGCTITCERKKGKYVYYRCTGYDKTCSQKKIYIREEELIKQFEEAVKAVSLDEKHIDYIKLGLKESFFDKREFSKERQQALQIQAGRIKDRLDKLYIDKLDGNVSNEFWHEKKTLWLNELEEIENLLHAFGETDKKYYDEGVKILELLKNAYSAYSKQNNQEKRKMLKCLLSNCILEDEKVRYDYNVPFSYFVNFASRKDKHPGLDSNQ
ncbi:MAG: recombinase family protein [Heliobacteriaceae bacterium]|nr:recombinase family protein [Heliobacteriaceae bacterium]